jgi:D-glycero-D-manno-heptose 1,7-bisphosphate phosphatase
MLRLVHEAGGRIGRIVVCPHGPDDACDCRKPKPGLLEQLAHHFDTSLYDVPVIGDALRDLEAAAAVGARPILVRTGKGRDTEASLPEQFAGVPVYDDLAAAARALIGEAA